MQSLVFEKKDQPMTDSLRVAERFSKRHADVLRRIESFTAANSGVSEEFSQRNFAQSKRRDERGKYQPIVNMTFDGFTLLTMGFTGKKAMQFKETYISEFNRMRSFIVQLDATKADFKELSEAIKQSHEELHPYHFSSEYDMINRIVLGVSSKKFKSQNGIPATCESIRPYLTQEQLSDITRLQKFDAGLVLMDTAYNDRKEVLTRYCRKMRQPVRLMA
jgi:Rha family phage regulatory protein